MAQQEQNEDAVRWQPAALVTQADRSAWQRQAARGLIAILARAEGLPAIRWSLSRTGSLCGQVTGQPAPAATIAAFARWREALGLEDCTEFTGASGLAHARARADWGMTRVTVAATVPAGGRTGAVPGWQSAAGSAAAYLTEDDVIMAAGRLALILDDHPGLEALSWAVSPSGELSARVGWQRSGRAALEVLRQWEQALGLEPGAPATSGTVTRQASLARRDGALIVVRATIVASPSSFARHRTAGTQPATGTRAAPRATPAGASRGKRVPGAAAETMSPAGRGAVRASLDQVPGHGRRPVQGP